MQTNGKLIASLEKRVERGIKWLDKKFGRDAWLKKIKLNKLDLSDGNTCVIGEVLGDYYLLGSEYGVEREEAAKMAFNVSEIDDFDEEDTTMSLLTSVWYSTLKGMGAKK